jgi:hypothetical protein
MPISATVRGKSVSSGDIPYNEIAALAHQLWIERGCPEGSPEEDWFQAEQKLRVETPTGG